MTTEELNSILTRLNEMETKKGAVRAWDMAGKILIPIVLALSAWMIGLEVRVSNLELQSRLHLENSPPQWLKNEIGAIKISLVDIELRLRAIESRGK